MTCHENLLLVRMLRYQGRLDDADLQRVVGFADSLPGHPALLDKLVSESLVDQEWADGARHYLVSKSRSRAGESDELHRLDRAFGQIALANGWIKLADLEDALLEQERLRRKNLHFRIGEILVRFEAIELERARDILREQGCATMQCGSCGKIVAVEDRVPSQCSCEGALSHPVFLELIRADD